MKFHLFVGALSLTLAAGLSQVHADETHDKNAEHPKADNTARNKGDADAGSLTPLDQSNDANDISLTSRVREALVDDDSLGTDAKNVKVITAGGVVTLRGPVASAAEHTKILEIVARVASAAKVQDQIEVKVP